MSELLRASRPVSWINTAFPFGAAYLLAGGGPDAAFWVGCLFFLVPYNLAMYGINDVFDYESDMRNPRKGGIEGHILAPAHHTAILWAALLSCLPFVLFFLVVGSWTSTGVLALSLFAVAAYSVKGLRFKEIPVLDSLTSSTHFSSPAWFALALLGAWPSRAGWLVLAAFFAWGVASQAFGAVQDIVPDRQAGIASIATVLGARPTVLAAVALYAAAGALVACAGWPTCLGGLLALPYIANTARFARLTDAQSGRAHPGWSAFIWLNYAAGFCATLLIIWSLMR
ncbi:prenyltransferase [Brevibacterium sp. 5221]|uniref:Prenyltransferase n=1 Tax=Brevibacterium rongguiense TaxID=2695267 RepID=A0A6N9H624_9MICO|nr:prenyltransferase [Brevibacterium rongguiense]WAL41647.1 prenyltransferase [Brevibacterium sp. BRM-1]